MRFDAWAAVRLLQCVRWSERVAQLVARSMRAFPLATVYSRAGADFPACIYHGPHRVCFAHICASLRAYFLVRGHTCL